MTFGLQSFRRILLEVNELGHNTTTSCLDSANAHGSMDILLMVRNPARKPVEGKVVYALVTGIYTSQVVQDFFHKEYESTVQGG